mmetsp:Transcript_9237/g.22688  ORF Transcript_9237/g.22688 Transcript_9237/m.22688 type:complete len:92 (-) Transcript_9237:7-282(-)
MRTVVPVGAFVAGRRKDDGNVQAEIAGTPDTAKRRKRRRTRRKGAAAACCFEKILRVRGIERTGSALDASSDGFRVVVVVNKKSLKSSLIF